MIRNWYNLLPHVQLDWTVKDLQFCFRTSALSWRLKIWFFRFRSGLTAKDLKFRFRSVFTAKDLKFRVRIFVLPWLPKMWSSASALTAKYVKFSLRTSTLPWLAKIWSSAFRTCSARTSKDVKFRFRISSLSGFAVSLPHFRSILTTKALKIGFSTNNVPPLPNMGSSVSALPFCMDCKRSVVSHFRSAFIPKDVNALLPSIDCQSSASSVPL